MLDPLGHFTQFMLRMRALLKKILARSEQKWDDKTNEEDKEQFQDGVRELVKLKNVPLKKRYFDECYEKTNLNFFSDVSLESMCSVVYLRAEDDHSAKKFFVIGKCRNAPIKQQTIRKRKLQAALYFVRLRQLITADHDTLIQPLTHWRDSMTVLQWLNSSDRKQQVFVANPVREILDQSTVDEWRLVKDSGNPAREVLCVTVVGKWLAKLAGLAEVEPKQLSRVSKAGWYHDFLLMINQTESIMDWSRFSKYKNWLTWLFTVSDLNHSSVEFSAH